MLHPSIPDYNIKHGLSVQMKEVEEFIKLLVMLKDKTAAKIFMMSVLNIDYTESCFVLNTYSKVDSKTIMAPKTKYRRFCNPEGFDGLLAAIDNPHLYEFPDGQLFFRECSIKNIT